MRHGRFSGAFETKPATGGASSGVSCTGKGRRSIARIAGRQSRVHTGATMTNTRGIGLASTGSPGKLALSALQFERGTRNENRMRTLRAGYRRVKPQWVARQGRESDVPRFHREGRRTRAPVRGAPLGQAPSPRDAQTGRNGGSWDGSAGLSVGPGVGGARPRDRPLFHPHALPRCPRNGTKRNRRHAGGDGMIPAHGGSRGAP